MQNIEPRRAAAAVYDPFYDPLRDRSIGQGGDYAPTYWIGTAGAPPDDTVTSAVP